MMGIMGLASLADGAQRCSATHPRRGSSNGLALLPQARADEAGRGAATCLRAGRADRGAAAVALPRRAPLAAGRILPPALPQRHGPPQVANVRVPGLIELGIAWARAD